MGLSLTNRWNLHKETEIKVYKILFLHFTTKHLMCNRFKYNISNEYLDSTFTGKILQFVFHISTKN